MPPPSAFEPARALIPSRIHATHEDNPDPLCGQYVTLATLPRHTHGVTNWNLGFYPISAVNSLSLIVNPATTSGIGLPRLRTETAAARARSRSTRDSKRVGQTADASSRREIPASSTPYPNCCRPVTAAIRLRSVSAPSTVLVGSFPATAEQPRNRRENPDADCPMLPAPPPLRASSGVATDSASAARQSGLCPVRRRDLKGPRSGWLHHRAGWPSPGLQSSVALIGNASTHIHCTWAVVPSV
jgi:hypothetical protein